MKTVGELNGWTWEELEPSWRHHIGDRTPMPPSSIHFVQQGNFTICEVCVAPDLRAFGAAKRAASFDRYNAKVGRLASFGRACIALAWEMAKERQAQVVRAMCSITGAVT